MPDPPRAERAKSAYPQPKKKKKKSDDDELDDILSNMGLEPEPVDEPEPPRRGRAMSPNEVMDPNPLPRPRTGQMRDRENTKSPSGYS